MGLLILEGYEYLEGSHRITVVEITGDRVYFTYQHDNTKAVHTEIRSLAEDDWKEVYE